MTTHDDKFPAKLFRSSRTRRVNPEGLTWAEWEAAARFGGGKPASMYEESQWARAWEKGVDPTEMGQ